MLYAFVYTEVAVLVRHWFEVGHSDSHLEHGVRLELRLRSAEPQRGTESAAQKIAIDRPLWRADLFDRIDGTPGAFEVAHYHPYFNGVEPCERHWADEIKATPWDWLHAQLSDIAGVAATGGAQLRDPSGESEQVRADASAIIDAARSRAALQCGSTEQCYAWTQDAASHVHRMLDGLAHPELLDRDRAAPWLSGAAA